MKEKRDYDGCLSGIELIIPIGFVFIWFMVLLSKGCE